MKLNVLPTLSGHNLIFPMYHCVSDESLPHIKQLYHCLSIKEFEKALNSILRYYNPVSLEDVYQHTHGIKKITEPSFHLSFDDGFSTLYYLVAPTLLKKGIPATFFINSGFIDNLNLMFRCKVSLIISSINSDAQIQKLSKYFNCNANLLNSYMLSLKYSDTDRIDNACSEIGINIQEYLQHKKPYLTSQQLLELSSKGFSIGSHSVDHPEFRFLPLNNQIIQITDSINYIRKQITQKYSVFSFPFTDFGINNDFFNIVFDPEKPVVDLTFGTAGIRDDKIKFNIQRIPMDKNRAGAMNTIKWQFFKYLVYKMIGNQLVKR
jgi:peptidoglycan/xylan/chitin deacetylase (PgdA/CDA1 family)